MSAQENAAMVLREVAKVCDGASPFIDIVVIGRDADGRIGCFTLDDGNDQEKVRLLRIGIELLTSKMAGLRPASAVEPIPEPPVPVEEQTLIIDLVGA